MMRGLIELENMEFHAGHGCYDLEKIVGNRFLVSVSLESDVEKAAEDDDLSESINYLKVYETVREQMAVTSDILENVTKRIIDALYDRFPNILKAKVKVSKLAPPLGGKVDKVSVTLVK